jgi:hypothetical protein
VVSETDGKSAQPAARPTAGAAISIAKSAVRLVAWLAIVLICLVAVFVLFPPPGAVPGHMPPTWPLETLSALVVMLLSIAAIALLAKRKAPTRRGWIAVLGIVLAVGAAALWQLPQWSGLIVVGVFIPFVVAPIVLIAVAHHHAAAGGRRRAAIYGRLASYLHPSKPLRFNAAVLTAQALGPVEAKVPPTPRWRATPRPSKLPLSIAVPRLHAMTGRAFWTKFVVTRRRHG